MKRSKKPHAQSCHKAPGGNELRKLRAKGLERPSLQWIWGQKRDQKGLSSVGPSKVPELDLELKSMFACYGISGLI